MTGSIVAGSPWMRSALRDFTARYPDTLADLEQDIPDGYHIALTCNVRPRPLGAILVGPSGEVARVEPGYPTVAAACGAVLARSRQIVVEDAGGYVVVAERGA